MADVKNHLIELLPRKDRLRLLAICEPVELALQEVLCEPQQPASHAWFPLESFVSLVAQTEAHPGLEVGMVGSEGMVGAHLALGVADSPLHAVVQGGGTAWRVDAGLFRKELAASPALRQGMDRYIYVLMRQLATAAPCLRFHLIQPRLARWLLMSQDRAHGDTFRVTHEFLAYMLGVRRAGVTTAAGALQECGLISYTRGHISVLDRPALEAAACSCYMADRRVYAALL
ncbi:MAG: Crp/Fnr family transcriptional regulator [Comamonadaceae bacterium]|nr:MAG: Crp/Fnr family transcriptional regulator [Comamonadaceae bacterium]